MEREAVSQVLEKTVWRPINDHQSGAISASCSLETCATPRKLCTSSWTEVEDQGFNRVKIVAVGRAEGSRHADQKDASMPCRYGVD